MPKTLTLKEIADAVDGRLIGNGSRSVSRLAHPADILGSDDLALAMSEDLLPLLQSNAGIAAVVAENEGDASFISDRIEVKRPRLALARLTALFENPVNIKSGIHPSAIVEEGANIGKGVAIGAMVYVGANSIIGDNTVLHPQSYVGDGAEIGEGSLIYSGARIGAGTKLGKRAIIHFNASIGADGFSFVTVQTGSVEEAKTSGKKEVTATNTDLVRIASLAPVVIGDDVEIGANSCIDRGTIASTRVGSGTKIDNHVQIGHNVSIGDNCMICGRVGIAGSAVIGNRVVLGGAVGVADHVTIGDDAIAMAMSGIAGNVPAKSVVGGIPATSRDKMMENLFNLGRLKRLFAKVDQLSEKIGNLEKAKNQE